MSETTGALYCDVVVFMKGTASAGDNKWAVMLTLFGGGTMLTFTGIVRFANGPGR